MGTATPLPLAGKSALFTGAARADRDVAQAERPSPSLRVVSAVNSETASKASRRSADSGYRKGFIGRFHRQPGHVAYIRSRAIRAARDNEEK